MFYLKNITFEQWCVKAKDKHLFRARQMAEDERNEIMHAPRFDKAAYDYADARWRVAGNEIQRRLANLVYARDNAESEAEAATAQVEIWKTGAERRASEKPQLKGMANTGLFAPE